MNKNILLDKKCIVKANFKEVEKELSRLFPYKSKYIDLSFIIEYENYVVFYVGKGYFNIFAIDKVMYKEFEKSKTMKLYGITLKDLKGLK
jgi:hypothetical protein